VRAASSPPLPACDPPAAAGVVPYRPDHPTHRGMCDISIFACAYPLRNAKMDMSHSRRKPYLCGTPAEASGLVTDPALRHPYRGPSGVPVRGRAVDRVHGRGSPSLIAPRISINVWEKKYCFVRMEQSSSGLSAGLRGADLISSLFF
jgi:hypothetical protein